MQFRKPPRTLFLTWLAMAILIVAGLVIGLTVNQTVGIVLFVIGCAGYLLGGLFIFFRFPHGRSA